MSFKSLLERLKALTPLFVFIALIVNIFIVISFEKSRKPQVVYCVRPAETNHVEKSSDPSPIVSESILSSTPSKTPSALSQSTSSGFPSVLYDFFVVNGRRGVQMWGRLFSEGSPTSYGRIVTIFPDRILLEDGSFIINEKWHGSRSTPASSNLLFAATSKGVL